MGEIIELRPGRRPETILDFICRMEVATTAEVAYRFGLGMYGAHRELSALRKFGRLASALSENRNGAVKMSEWRIAPATR